MINIRELYPDYYNGVYEFDNIAAAEEATFNGYVKTLAEQLNNLFISTSDIDGIKLFEDEYNITPEEGADIETRRRKLISILLPPSAITLPFFDKLLSALNLKVKSEVDSVKLIYKSIVSADEFSDENIKELNNLLKIYVPVNVTNVIYKYAYAGSELGSYIGIANTVKLYSHADYVKE